MRWSIQVPFDVMMARQRLTVVSVFTCPAGKGSAGAAVDGTAAAGATAAARGLQYSCNSSRRSPIKQSPRSLSQPGMVARLACINHNRGPRLYNPAR
jgi:hypothetical protein